MSTRLSVLRAVAGATSLLAFAACSDVTPLTPPSPIAAPGGTMPRATRNDGVVGADYITGQVIVRYRDGVDDEAVANRHGGTVARTLLGADAALVEVADGQERAAVVALAADPDVLSAELDYLTVVTPCEVGLCLAADDAFVAMFRWDLNNNGFIRNSSSATGALQPTGKVDADVDFNESFDALGGTAFTGSARVGILDTGIRPDHLEFANGRVVAARNFAVGYPATLIEDRNGHGTHVAGIAAGLADGIGTAGTAFGTNIQVINAKICEFYNFAPPGGPDDIRTACPTSSQADAIVWAVDQGANVLNMSIGGSPLATSGSPAVQAALAYAISRNVLPVCAAGNNNYPNVSFPARFADCLSVGATNWSDDRASYSNYGGKLEIMAPGGDGNSLNTASSLILSASFSAPNRYTWMAGTSMAAPQVTGIAAMLYATGMTSVADVKARLLATADDLGAPGYDAQFGNGRVNMYRALTLQDPSAPPIAVIGGSNTGVEGTPVAFVGDGSSDPNNHPITYLWNFGDGSTSTAANPTNVFADNGSYTVTLAVTDESNLTTMATTTVTIDNAAPTVSASIVPPRILSGQTATLEGMFGDLGALDAAWSWSVLSRDGTATGSTATIGAISSAARYCSVGATPVTLLVTDKDGGVGQATATLLVDANGMAVKLPSRIKLKPKGSVEVEIYGSATLNVRSIDLASLRVGGASPSVDKRGRMKLSFRDRNRDGFPDLEIDMARAGLVLTPGVTVVPVTLTLTDRCTQFAGSQTVTVRLPGSDDSDSDDRNDDDGDDR